MRSISLALLCLGAVPALARPDLCDINLEGHQHVVQNVKTGDLLCVQKAPFVGETVSPCGAIETSHVCYKKIQGHNAIFKSTTGGLAYTPYFSTRNSVLSECESTQDLCYQTIGGRQTIIKHEKGAMIYHDNFVNFDNVLTACNPEGGSQVRRGRRLVSGSEDES